MDLSIQPGPIKTQGSREAVDSHDREDFREDHGGLRKVLIQDASLVLVRCVPNQRRLHGNKLNVRSIIHMRGSKTGAMWYN